MCKNILMKLWWLLLNFLQINKARIEKHEMKSNTFYYLFTNQITNKTSYQEQSVIN